MSDPASQTALKYLELALAEAQATVRAYDTKAQIVGIGYAFTLNIVASVLGGFPSLQGDAPLMIIAVWAIVMLPLVLFGYVLFPTRKIAPLVVSKTDVDLQRTLYVETGRHRSVEALEAAARASNWMHELSFEILKVSKLREMKRGRFVRALLATALSLLTLFVLQVVALV